MCSGRPVRTIKLLRKRHVGKATSGLIIKSLGQDTKVSGVCLILSIGFEKEDGFFVASF